MYYLSWCNSNTRMVLHFMDLFSLPGNPRPQKCKTTLFCLFSKESEIHIYQKTRYLYLKKCVFKKYGRRNHAN